MVDTDLKRRVNLSTFRHSQPVIRRLCSGRQPIQGNHGDRKGFVEATLGCGAFVPGGKPE